MTLKKQLAHNTAAQIIGKVISTLLGLVAISILTRYLGVEKFGWYGTTLGFLQFIAILIDFGLIPVTAQMMSEVPDSIKDEDTKGLASYRSKLFKNLLGFRFVTAVIGLGVAPFIALLFPYPPEVKIAIAFTTISMLAVAINQIFIGFYQSKLITHLQAVGEIIGRIVLIAGLLLCVYAKANFLSVMWAIILSSVAYTIALWIFTRKFSSPSFSFDFDIWKKITIKMWPIALSIVFNVIYLRGDILILSFFRDQVEVGLYVAAYRVIDIVAQTAMMVMGLMLPLLAYAWSKGEDTKFKEHFQLSFNIMMMFAIPMSVALIILSKQIMTIVAGPEYAAAAIPLTLLSVAVFGVYFGAVFGHVAVAVNRQKETLPVYISSAIITLLLYFILVPRYGIIGAAIGSVFSEVFVGFFLYLVVKKYAKFSISLMVSAKALFASILMALVLWLMNSTPYIFSLLSKTTMYVPSLTITKDLLLLLSVLSGASVYALTIILTKAVSPETIQDVLTLKKSS
ncbi:MAG TPA: flippase [Candidatus Magasanikbacteria bacterium]|nr:flippase [Candidatus Magasanikbacteria bacterium]